MTRKDLIYTFKETVDMCITNNRLNNAMVKSRKAQRFYAEGEKLVDLSVPSPKPARVIVTKKRTLQAAEAYANRGKTLVLSFASATNPGGGIVKGSISQEAELCRCSTLYQSLNVKSIWDEFYTPHRETAFVGHNDDCILTPNVIVFREDKEPYKVLKERDWFEISVISCSAPNLSNTPANILNPGESSKTLRISESELYMIHLTKARRILQIAQLNGYSNLVLGAIGCGNAANDPETVATAWRNAILEKGNMFDNIEFAVFSTGHHKENYKVFSRVFRDLR